MKKNTLKTITLVLIILLICLISFVGIYQKKLNRWENILPEYQLGMDFGGARAVRLDVDLGTQTLYFDENGNQVEHTHEEGEEHSEEEKITEKEVLVNPEEVLNSQNYAKVKEILQKRLKDMRAEEYQFRQDENGNIAIELKENENTDTYIEALSNKGVFTIKDSQTNELLLDNSNIKDAKAVTYTESTGSVAVYLVINFDKAGTEKLEEISKTYVETTDEEGNKSTKNVLITLDDETIMNTYFGQTMSTGELQIPIGEATTSATTLSTYIKEAHTIATILRNGALPIAYEIGYNNSFTSSVTPEVVQAIMIVMSAIIVLMIVYLVVRYKVKGLLGGISWLGFLATLLIIVRYTNCIISANSLIAIAIISIVDYIFLNALLRNKEKKTFKELWIHYIILGIPMYIIAIVFAFGTAISISSFGMVLFWGSVLMLAYNILITKNLLDAE